MTLSLKDLDSSGFCPSPVRLTGCGDDEEVHSADANSHHDPLPFAPSRLLP